MPTSRSWWWRSLLVIAGIVAFYLLGTPTDWQRWGPRGRRAWRSAVAVFGSLGRAARRFWQFILDSRVELRKVVWPTRQETCRRPQWCLAFVIIAGLFFWVLDLFLSWATRLLTGQGG